MLYPTQVHQLRNLLTVILCAIETDKPQTAKAAVRRMDAQLAACQCCPINIVWPEEAEAV